MFIIKLGGVDSLCYKRGGVKRGYSEKSRCRVERRKEARRMEARLEQGLRRDASWK